MTLFAQIYLYIYICIYIYDNPVGRCWPFILNRMINCVFPALKILNPEIVEPPKLSKTLYILILRNQVVAPQAPPCLPTILQSSETPPWPTAQRCAIKTLGDEELLKLRNENPQDFLRQGMFDIAHGGHGLNTPPVTHDS